MCYEVSYPPDECGLQRKYKDVPQIADGPENILQPLKVACTWGRVLC